MATDSSIKSSTDQDLSFETTKYCELIARNGSNVELKDGEKVLLDIGDSKEDKIDQVELLLDMHREEVSVTCLSDSPCTAGGVTLHRATQAVVGPGASLGLGGLTYMVFFGRRIVHPLKRPSDEDTGQGKQPKKSNSAGGVQSSLKRFFSSSSSKFVAPSCKWRKFDSLHIMTYGEQKPSSLIASYDLDGTITVTKSGALPFRTTPDDWKFFNPIVPKKLCSLNSADYRIVIFTNQAGMNHGQPSLSDFRVKIQAVMESIGDVSVILLAATGDDQYRKPLTGMWDYFTEHENGGVEVDMENSYFIGDAAGRNKDWKKGYKKDFSCSDRKFSANIGLPFHTPEEFFLGEPMTTDFTLDGFNPFELNYNEDNPTLDPSTATITSSSQEMVIFVGCPASGKTTFYKEHMYCHGYLHINRDKLGTMEKCVDEAKRALSMGHSVVIDNTSPSVESRQRFILAGHSIADSLKIRCFQFTTPRHQCVHNNIVRGHLMKDNVEYKPVGTHAFNHYYSVFTEPEMDEGFNEIVKVTVNLKFTNVKHEKLYKKFYH